MRRVLAAYLGLGLLLAPVPLLNVLQVESAAIVALVAFFVSGWAAVRAFGNESVSFWRVLGRQESALIVPLGVLTLAQLWAPNCTFAQGLLFFALFPGITVVFAVSVAYAVQGLELSRPNLAIGLLGGVIVVGGPLYDLGLHPQFYTYNHVFGGVLGPIYDEQLAVRSGLFVFRGLTLLWALVAVLIGTWARGRGPHWGLPVCALAIAAIYAFAAPLGINTPAWYLEEQLGGHTQTAHFELYYDSTQVDKSTAAILAQSHEARYDWIHDRLGLEAAEEGGRIQSYIYPNSDVKGRLTGARTTSVSPVWLFPPQIHLLRDRVSQSLGHELAHVVSRPYGLPGVHASWAPGIIEGWAVALEPPSAAPSPDDLVLTAATADTSTSLRTEAEAVAGRLSPWGFWTGRGAVSYATMGSFVQYLLDRYGPDKLKQVYAWGNFEAVYGQPLKALAEGWAAHLGRASVVARDAYGVVSRRFAQPSLFEVKCPHYVPPARQHLQSAHRAARRRDTTEMVDHLQRALILQPQFEAAHEALARIRLARGKVGAVRQQLDTLAVERRTIALQVALADAWALEGSPEAAQALYAEAHARTPIYAHHTRTRLMLRDAVATRPRVLRVLVSGDSAAVQARRLEMMKQQDAAVRSWRAVRWMEADQYGPALSIWCRNGTPIRSARPRSWHRAWTLQRTAWGAQAALQAGSTAVARRWATRAARKARMLGDRARVALFEWWASRANSAKEVPSISNISTRGRAQGPLSSRETNHALRLLVGGGRQKNVPAVHTSASNLTSSGSCGS